MKRNILILVIVLLLDVTRAGTVVEDVVDENVEENEGARPAYAGTGGVEKKEKKREKMKNEKKV